MCIHISKSIGKEEWNLNEPHSQKQNVKITSNFTAPELSSGYLHTCATLYYFFRLHQIKSVLDDQMCM